MSESPVRQRAQPANENLTRRAERGIVAGYIHELSKRHENGHPEDAGASAAAEATEGG